MNVTGSEDNLSMYEIQEISDGVYDSRVYFDGRIEVMKKEN